MKRFYILLVIAAMTFAACQEDTNPPVFQTPELRTGVTVSYHEVTIMDTVRFNSENVVMRIIYSEDSTMTNDVQGALTILIPNDSLKVYETKIKNLTSNTTYYYAYTFQSEFSAKNGKEVVRGKVKSFHTLENQAPDVVTKGCTEYGFHTAKVVCEKVSDNSDSQTTQWGVCFATHRNVNVKDGKKICDRVIDESYTFDLIELTAGTTYYYRAYGINKYGTSYGEEKSFRTVSESVMSVETQQPSSVGKTTAVLCGKVTCYETLNVTEKGFYISSTNSTPGENDIKIMSETAGGGAYQCVANSLTSGTEYYVRAYAVCQYGTLTGNVVSLTTK